MTKEEYVRTLHGKAQRDWFESRPAHIQEAILKTPDCWCYRMEGKGHYWIVSYTEHLDGTVTLRIAHGRDSFLPGVAVFGIPPESLEKCGCGKWEPPTQEQIKETGRELEIERRRRQWERN